jgi:D-alanyl-D-alanine carboxypeptidase
MEEPTMDTRTGPERGRHAARLLLVVATCAGLAAACSGQSSTSPAPSTQPPPSLAVTAPASPSAAASPIATPAPSVVATPVPSPAPSASAASLWTGAAVTQTPMSAADAAAVDAKAEAVMAQSPDLNGMWIGVWDPAKGYYMQAYGNAVKGGATATIDDHSRIGSVTKTLTVTAVLEQVAAGKLTLDTTIAEMLPDLAAKYPKIAGITVDKLAGMRSGIQDYANTNVVLPAVVKDPSKVWSADELIAAAMSLPLSPPGTGGYSTTNTLILGKMLEKITGKPIEQVVNDIAAQAGMTESALRAPADNAMPAPASHGYNGTDGAKMLASMGAKSKPGTDVTDWTMSWGGAGGGMYSTVADMGKWAATGLGTAFLPADLGARRLVTTNIPEGKYGLGIMEFGHGWYGHTGQAIGWESFVGYSATTGAAFVALVNDTASLQGAEMLGASLFPDDLGLALLGQ